MRTLRAASIARLFAHSYTMLFIDTDNPIPMGELVQSWYSTHHISITSIIKSSRIYRRFIYIISHIQSLELAGQHWRPPYVNLNYILIAIIFALALSCRRCHMCCCHRIVRHTATVKQCINNAEHYWR